MSFKKNKGKQVGQITKKIMRPREIGNWIIKRGQDSGRTEDRLVTKTSSMIH